MDKIALIFSLPSIYCNLCEDIQQLCWWLLLMACRSTSSGISHIFKFNHNWLMFGSSLVRFLLVITHSDAPQSVGLFWTSGQLVAQTSTWWHTILTTERHPCLGGIRTHDLSRRMAADLRIRPRGHWHWQIALIRNLYWCVCVCVCVCIYMHIYIYMYIRCVANFTPFYPKGLPICFMQWWIWGEFCEDRSKCTFALGLFLKGLYFEKIMLFMSKRK